MLLLSGHCNWISNHNQLVGTTHSYSCLKPFKQCLICGCVLLAHVSGKCTKLYYAAPLLSDIHVHEEVYTLYCMMYYCSDKALLCYNIIIIISILVQYIVSQLNNSAIFETVPDGATTLHFAACKMLTQCSAHQYCVSTHGSIHCTCYYDGRIMVYTYVCIYFG